MLCHHAFIFDFNCKSTINNGPLFTRTDLEECPDDGESSVDEDPGLSDEQQQVVQLQRGVGVV